MLLLSSEVSSEVSPEATAADFAACQAILRRGSKSFAAASLLLPRRVRVPAAALYGFCRMADDAIDLAREPGAVAELRRRVALAYAGSPCDHPVDRAFSAVALEHELPRELVEALLEGFAWDAEGRRYASLAELNAYAARVAGTVGAMMTVLMGARGPEALARACDLGVAMQLTNIARDVGEDARNGRVYLPIHWLEEAGVDVLALVARPAHSSALAAVIERLLGYADTVYVRAGRGIPLLPRDCRAAIRAARLIYAEIGRVVARRGFDAVSGRAVVSGRRKLWLVLCALFAGSGESPARAGLPALPEAQFLVEAAALPAPLGPRGRR
jgi:15-cis-phytoene synthase